MKVFISWSGKRSHCIAEALRWWLPNVIQSVEPFLSSQDIRKGARGNVVIADRLEDAKVGIICLTPENLTKPWILFEAGALSRLTSAYVCTYLIGDLSPSDIEPPLGQFQHSHANQQDTKALIETINGEVEHGRLDSKRLDDAFETWWGKLDEKLNSLPDVPEGEPQPSERSDESKLDEVLSLLRQQNRPRRVPISNSTIEQLSSSPGIKSRLDDFLLEAVCNDGRIDAIGLPNLERRALILGIEHGYFVSEEDHETIFKLTDDGRAVGKRLLSERQGGFTF